MLRKTTIKTRLAGLAAIALSAVVMCAALAMWSSARLTDYSERVFVSKDVVADILPPPLYLIEMRLVVSRLFEKNLDPAAAKQEIERLAKEYDERIAYWNVHPLHGLERKLLGPQHEHGQKFIAAARALAAKAASTKNIDDLRSELAALHLIYEQHRAGVDLTVAEGNKFAADEIANFGQTVSTTRHLIIGASVAVVMLLVALFVILLRSITQPLTASVGTLKRIAEGDLSQTISTEGQDEISAQMLALADMQRRLAHVVGNVRESSNQVSAASAEIAEGNQDLSARTEAQASVLEQTVASMEELSTAVKQNADNATQANKLAQNASAVALKGGEVMGDVVEKMKTINESSKRIFDIIGVIDSIAFQTNILALNAAVEASRAGEQGRGFAVVASEVRTLAARSADAAKEIKTLIGVSVERVEQGYKLVDNAGKTIKEVVSSIGRVTEIMSDISLASGEQSAGVAQMTSAVAEMDRVTQQNAAMVEEIAAAAAALNAQAQELVKAVAVFRLASSH